MSAALLKNKRLNGLDCLCYKQDTPTGFFAERADSGSWLYVAGPDIDLRRQRAVDWTFVGNLKQPLFLFCGQRATELDISVNAVEHPLPCFAVPAIGGIFFRMAQPNCDGIERPALAPGIHGDSH